METNETIRLLIALVFVILFIIFILGIVLIVLKTKKSQKNITKIKEENTQTNSLGINKESIFKFMDFETIEDCMIIQKDYKRFLMVIECQGVNYDLMSGVEKTGVEEGFIQFLNTLRYPIQLYIQTRAINLEESLQRYKERVDKIEDNLTRMKLRYEQMQESEGYTRDELNKAFVELTKQTNLCEYGKDIIFNTEKISLNKNVLNKKYYIIIPYYASELQNNDLSKEETVNLVFSEIYTRAQSTIRSIMACGVKGKILRNNELIELLYMAYNRDEAEVFGVNKAMQAGYDEMYVTAPDVLNKKMRELDKMIEEKAIEKAKEKINEVQTEKEMEIAEKEDNLDKLIDEMAKIILAQNQQYVGKDVTEKAIQKIEEEGGSQNGKKTTRKTRRTTK